MSNELYNVLARAADGLYEGVAIGGDSYPGSTLSDHCIRYQVSWVCLVCGVCGGGGVRRRVCVLCVCVGRRDPKTLLTKNTPPLSCPKTQPTPTHNHTQKNPPQNPPSKKQKP